MHVYSQDTGELYRGGKLEAKGYAGRDAGKNNPTMQNVKGVGPLPVGYYTLGEPHDSPTVGKYAILLTPDPENEMFSRASFYMHGDSKEHPGLASHGCIVLPRADREDVIATGDKRLRVVASYANTV